MPAPLKIFHLLMSREFAGTESYLATLAKAQAAQGHQVHVLLKAQSPSIKRRWREETELAGHKGPGSVTFHFMPARLPKRFAGLWSFLLARRLKPHVAHAHLGRAARYLGRGCQWAGVPLVCTLHLRYRKKDAAHANALIAIAGWQLQDIPEDLKKKTTIIWNWSNPNNVAQQRTTNHQPSTINFLSVGRLVPQKGMDILIEAFLTAFPKKTDVHLTIVGEGTERAKLQTLAGGDDRITFAGYQSHVGPFYAQATAFVSAARYEPFGLVLLEAMEQHLPLISTRSEGPSEFLQNYPVIWAEKEHITSLSTALSTAYQQAKKGKLPRVTYDMSPFDINTALKKIEDVYASVAPRRK